MDSECRTVAVSGNLRMDLTDRVGDRVNRGGLNKVTPDQSAGNTGTTGANRVMKRLLSTWTGSQRLATPIRIATRFGTVSFLNTLTVFGTPSDVTLAELALEMLFAADDETVEIVKRMERERIAVAASVSDRRPVADDVRA